MATISRLQPGQTVYTVERQKMGNTTVSYGALIEIHIVEVDPEGLWVMASRRGRPARKYRESDAKKWRVSKPKPKYMVFGSTPSY